MFYLASNYNSDAIFVFPGVDLYKRILISNQNSDLKISASSTYRIFLWSKNKVSRIFLASGKSMIKLFFLWSIWPVSSFNLAYCRPNSVNYVKLHNRSNTWQLLLIHPVVLDIWTFHLVHSSAWWLGVLILNSRCTFWSWISAWRLFEITFLRSYP